MPFPRTLFASLCLGIMPMCQALAADKPSFSLPLDCAGETRCFLQNLVDMDLGERRLDAFCGSATYNGHKGTDIRVVTIPMMERGIPILAMADGVVVGMRDGENDNLVATPADRRAVAGKECGNGAIIDHGVIGQNRWTTQYCHMRRGTMTVRNGQRVKRGERLGDMGLSGFTTFPHIHVTLRHGKTIIDPFTSLAVGPNPACTRERPQPLFDEAALAALQADDSPLMQAGFTSAQVRAKEVMAADVPPPTQDKPLIFYAYFKNLLKGDQLRISIQEDGKTYSDNTQAPLRVDKASYVIFAGRRSGAKAGATYTGRTSILRNGKTVFESPVTELRF